MQFAQTDCHAIIILTQWKRLYAAPLLLNFCARSFEHISEMLRADAGLVYYIDVNGRPSYLRKSQSRRRKTGYKRCTIHMTNNFHLLHAIKPSKRHPVFVFALDSILFMSYSTVNSILSQLNCYVLQYFRAILKTGIHKKNVHFCQYITSLFNTFTNSYLFCIFITNKLHFAATNRLVP